MNKLTEEFMEELYQLIEKYIDRGMSPLMVILTLQTVTRKLINLSNDNSSKDDSSDFKVDGDLK